jgi:glutathione synthase/RimK-type ligase-like ATP-grasp enzyme
MSDFLAIAREPVYSPGKVEQDRAILEAVAACLSAAHTVRVVDVAEQVDDPTPQTIVFAMCQGPDALARLRRWEHTGIRIVNTPQAIENCHRHRMLAAFDHFQVPHPPSVLVSAQEENGLPNWTKGAFWLKRGDVHATHSDDVVLVHDLDDAHRVLRGYRRRGIADALIQQHVEGDLIKFYATRGGFFHWLSVDGETLRLETGEERAMVDLARSGAAALGLEVYGGDCIRDRSGRLWLIDLNDWPSYGACRMRAAEAIAAYLDAQTRPSTT